MTSCAVETFRAPEWRDLERDSTSLRRRHVCGSGVDRLKDKPIWFGDYRFGAAKYSSDDGLVYWLVIIAMLVQGERMMAHASHLLFGPPFF